LTWNIDLVMFFPSDVRMYLKNNDTNSFYYAPSKDHLKNILQNVIQNDINWNGNLLQNEIEKWWVKNKDKVVWDSDKFRYKPALDIK